MERLAQQTPDCCFMLPSSPQISTILGSLGSRSSVAPRAPRYTRSWPPRGSSETRGCSSSKCFLELQGISQQLLWAPVGRGCFVVLWDMPKAPCHAKESQHRSATLFELQTFACGHIMTYQFVSDPRSLGQRCSHWTRPSWTLCTKLVDR